MRNAFMAWLGGRLAVARPSIYSSQSLSLSKHQAFLNNWCRLQYTVRDLKTENAYYSIADCWVAVVAILAIVTLFYGIIKGAWRWPPFKTLFVAWVMFPETPTSTLLSSRKTLNANSRTPFLEEPNNILWVGLNSNRQRMAQSLKITQNVSNCKLHTQKYLKVFLVPFILVPKSLNSGIFPLSGS